MSRTMGKDDDDKYVKTDELLIYKSELKANSYTIYLHNEIGSIEKYADLFDTLNNASQYDVIDLHIASPGGQVSTGLEIIAAMRDCACPIGVTVNSDIFSMASIIAIQGSSLTLGPAASLMFHAISSVELGKQGEIEASVNSLKRLTTTIENVYCKPFLTTKELSDIRKGSDLYFTRDDIIERFKKVLHARAKNKH